MQELRFQGITTALGADGVLVVTLDRPEHRNGFSAAMKRDLVEVVTQAQADDTVRVVVFTGAGEHFSAGDDIRPGIDSGFAYNDGDPSLVPKAPRSRIAPIRTYSTLRTFSQDVTRSIRRLDKLTVAAVEGLAVQSGLSLALACDFKVASRTAKLGSGTLRFGFLPDEGGHALLVEHIGVARTMDFLMFRRFVDGAAAAALGLVNEAVEPGTALGRAMALARELATGPQVAMRLLKRAIYVAAETDLERSLEDIATRTAISDNHEDAHEGAQAFAQRRPPAFNSWLE